MTQDDGVRAHRILSEAELVPGAALPKTHDGIAIDTLAPTSACHVAAEDFMNVDFRSIGADQAIAVALSELDRDVFEQRLAPN
jgi:hypothetical protein